MKNIKKSITAVFIILILIIGIACAVAESDEWKCPTCGATNTTNFCIKCGTKKPEDIICPECGTKYPADTEAVFCGTCGNKLELNKRSAIRYEGEGFDSPEEALTFYMEGLGNLNLEQMLGAFAWETQMKHLSMLKIYEKMGGYVTAMPLRIPVIDEFTLSANINILRSAQIELIYNAIENCLLGENYPEKNIISMRPEDITVFLEQFDNGILEKLTRMSSIRFISPDDFTDGYYSKNKENLIRDADYYGADEIVNIIGIASAGDLTVYCCPTIARYGDKWFLIKVGSITSDMLKIHPKMQAFVVGKDILEGFSD